MRFAAGALYSFLNRLSVREMDDHDPMIALYARADRVWNAPVIHVGMVPRELESIAIDLEEEGALGKAAHRETRPNQDGDGGSRATAKREPVRSEASPSGAAGRRTSIEHDGDRQSDHRHDEQGVDHHVLTLRGSPIIETHQCV